MKKFLHCVELNTGEFAITTVAKLQLTLIIAYVFFRNQLIIIINVVSWLQVWEGSVWYIFRCFGISYIYIKPMLSSTAQVAEKNRNKNESNKTKISYRSHGNTWHCHVIWFIVIVIYIFSCQKAQISNSCNVRIGLLLAEMVCSTILAYIPI